MTGDELELLFRDRYRPMVRLAAWLVGDRAAAEEIVQDAFVGLAKQIGRTGHDGGETVGFGPDRPESYLRAAVVNLCRSHHRRNGFRRRAFPLLRPSSECEPGPDEFLADTELVDAMIALPRRQRECVALRYGEDLTVDQIAAELGIGAGSVKTHLHRGLRSIEDRIGPDRNPSHHRSEQ